MKGRLILLLLVLLCGVGGVKAQNVEYIAEVDTNYIMIGDQIHFRMKVLDNAHLSEVQNRHFG